MTGAAGHSHSHDNDPGVEGWWKVMDWAVWVAVAILAALAVEWLIGKVVRESVSAQASRYLQKVAPATEQPPGA